jgi:hypothetical protein
MIRLSAKTGVRITRHCGDAENSNVYPARQTISSPARPEIAQFAAFECAAI